MSHGPVTPRCQFSFRTLQFRDKMRKTINAKMGHDNRVRDGPYNYCDPSLGVNIGSSLVSVDCNVLAEAREHNT